MKRIVSIEIRRSLQNSLFLAALCVGAAISISQILMVVVPTLQGQLKLIGIMKNVYPYSVYNIWIGGEAYTIHPEVLNLLLPLIAVLPYGCSMYEDAVTGYSNNICVRVPKRKYKLAKGIAAFVSGGFASAFPYALNLFLSLMIIPAIKPSATSMMFPVFDSSMFSGVFYTHPLLYCILFLVILFIVGGLMSELSICTYWMFSNVFAVFVLPFVYWILEAYILEMSGLPVYAIRYYARPDQPVNNLSFHVLLVKLILGVLILIIFNQLGNKKSEVV